MAKLERILFWIREVVVSNSVPETSSTICQVS